MCPRNFQDYISSSSPEPVIIEPLLYCQKGIGYLHIETKETRCRACIDSKSQWLRIRKHTLVVDGVLVGINCRNCQKRLTGVRDGAECNACQDKYTEFLRDPTRVEHRYSEDTLVITIETIIEPVQ